MKRIFTTLLCLILFSSSMVAQYSCPTATDMNVGGICNYADWNWEVQVSDPSFCNMWNAKTSFSSTLARLGSPFVQPVGSKLVQISLDQDYTKVKGWELLRRDFGCTHDVGFPYFVLYNKYSGLIRVFVYINNLSSQGYNGIVMTWRPLNSQRTAVTSNARDILLAPDKYLSPRPTGEDELTVYVARPTGMSNWVVGEFNAMYDPNVRNSLFTDNTFEIEVFGLITSTINADIQGTIFTEDYAFYGKSSEIKQNPQTPGGITKFVAAGKKALQFFTDADAARKNINDAAKKVMDRMGTTFDKKWKAEIWYNANKVKTKTDTKSAFGTALGGIIGAITGGNEILKFVGNVFGILTKNDSQANQDVPSVAPTMSTVDLTLSGTIDTKLIVQTIDIQVPGTVHSAISNLPFYDCALGIFNINNTPVLEYINYNRYCGRKHVRTEIVDGHPYAIYDNIYEPYSSYRVANNIYASVNRSAGLEVVSIKAALVGVVPTKSDGTALFDPFTTDIGITEYDNAFLRDVMTGRTEVSFYDVEKGLHVFQTPFVNLECFKGVAFNVRNETKVSIRISAILKKANALDTDPPIFYQRDYGFDGIAGVNPPNTEYLQNEYYVLPPYTNYTEKFNEFATGEGEEDLIINSMLAPDNGPSAYYYPQDFEAYNKIEVTTSGPVYGTIKAGRSVTFLPGYTTQPHGPTMSSYFPLEVTVGFGYKISCTSPAPVGSSNCPVPYNSSAFKKGNLINTEEELTEGSIAYPNPTTGKFFINLEEDSKEVKSITIENSIGITIKNVTAFDIESDIASIDMSDVTDGLYFIKIDFNSGKRKSIKIMKVN